MHKVVQRALLESVLVHSPLRCKEAQGETWEKEMKVGGKCVRKKKKKTQLIWKQTLDNSITQEFSNRLVCSISQERVELTCCVCFDAFGSGDCRRAVDRPRLLRVLALENRSYKRRWNKCCYHLASFV